MVIMTIKTPGVRIYKEACATQYSYMFHIGHNMMKTIRVTIFGDSAGAASAGHLMLSQEATGLFHQVSLNRSIGIIIYLLLVWLFPREPFKNVLAEFVR